MSDSNGSQSTGSQPVFLTTTMKTTAEDDAKPYERITHISMATPAEEEEKGDYYLALGQKVAPTLWSEDKETETIKLVAKIFLTRRTMKLLSTALLETLNDEDTPVERG